MNPIDWLDYELLGNQAINLFIYERFAEEEIEFAYPTQTLYVAQTNAT